MAKYFEHLYKEIKKHLKYDEMLTYGKLEEYEKFNIVKALWKDDAEGLTSCIVENDGVVDILESLFSDKGNTCNIVVEKIIEQYYEIIEDEWNAVREELKNSNEIDVDAIRKERIESGEEK